MPYVIVSSIFRAVELKHRYLRVVDYPKIPLEEELSDDDKIEYAVSQIKAQNTLLPRTDKRGRQVIKSFLISCRIQSCI